MLIYIHGFNSAPHSFKARITGERMRAHIKYLASDLLEGRGLIEARPRPGR